MHHTFRAAPAARRVLPSLAAAVVLAASPLALARQASGQEASAQTEQERAGQARGAAGVAVTRVTLATGGLAEVEGTMVRADSAMRLAIERPQIADVLRTLVVTGEAPVVSIDLDAAEPVGERSVVGRLLAGNLADPATVLRSLIGETIELSGGTSRLAGTLLAFEAVTIPPVEGEGEPRPAYRVAVATAEGRIAFATFETLDQLAIEGEAVSGRMEGVAPAIAETVDDGRRELTVTLRGEAQADFSFVVPTTVWRPSYRAIVAEDGSARLQGWATLENTTGLDWRGIDLRLAVGTPVAYAQDIYSPLRTTRPDAPFAVGETAETDLVAPDRRRAMPEAAPAEAMLDAAAAVPAPAPGGQPAPLETGGVESGSATTVFDVPGTIDLAAGRTLSVPFLDVDDSVGRVAFMPAGGGDRPRVLDALEVTFDAEASVPGGLVAVFDGRGFAGDARFGGADGSETALLPFAISADVDAAVTTRRVQGLASASIRDGLFVLRRTLTTTTALRLSAAGPVALVADLSRNGEEIVATATNGVAPTVDVRDRATARLRAALPEGETVITLVATRPLVERYQVSDLPSPIIEEALSLGDALDADTRAQLEAIAEAAAEIVRIDRRVRVLEAEITDLREALATDRDTLRALDARTPEGATIRERMVERANLLDAALGELRELRRRAAEQRDALGRG